jgi:hypothetical protein
VVTVSYGSGGSASSANCKLQAFYEYKRGELSFFEITAGVLNMHAQANAGRHGKQRLHNQA